MQTEMGLLAKKIGMTEYFQEDGTRVPVTVLAAKGNFVTAHRTEERDGYTALQLGFGEQKASRKNKAELGHLKKSESTPKRIIREFRVDASKLEAHAVGTEIPMSIFEEGAVIDVTGTSKGKGFQGVIKRHNMKGEKQSHGQHEVYRHGGSIGCRLTPGRVMKGKRMAGQMGNERVTVQNLKIAKVMEEQGVILVRGPIPGAKNGYVIIRHSVKSATRKRHSGK
jgi:large subunit ribosomal protein L3